uniref:phage tail protein n=1 Tax=Stappia sp. TaxID=1870903 RepID=UPI003BA92A98
MAEPFLAEVRMMGFNFPPRGWAFCDGQILPISQNQSLYSLLGTTYGGDGRTTFALPDLRGRTPIHVGRSDGGAHHSEGQKSGEETHTLSVNEMPQHMHAADAISGPGTTPIPQNAYLADLPSGYTDPGASLTSLRSNTVTHVGGSQAHQNMQPYLTVSFCIAIEGLFPSRN